MRPEECESPSVWEYFNSLTRGSVILLGGGGRLVSGSQSFVWMGWPRYSCKSLFTLVIL